MLLRDEVDGVLRELGAEVDMPAEVLAKLLQDGVQAAARLMAVSDRTLRRRLKSHGRTVTSMKRSFRSRLHMRLDGLSSAAKAAVLGFSHVESYRRFRRHSCQDHTGTNDDEVSR